MGTMGNRGEALHAGGLPAVVALDGGASKDARGPTGQEGRKTPSEIQFCIKASPLSGSLRSP